MISSQRQETYRLSRCVKCLSAIVASDFMRDVVDYRMMFAEQLYVRVDRADIPIQQFVVLYMAKDHDSG